MGLQYLEIGKMTTNDVIRKRLSLLVLEQDPLKARAFDMKYHLPCLVKGKRECQRNEEKSEEISEETKRRLIADFEITEIVSNELHDGGEKVLNLNEIQTTYIAILNDLGCAVPEKPIYKKYLKVFILDNVKDVHFSKPKRKNEPEQVMSTRVSQSAIETSLDVVKTIQKYLKLQKF